jgi:hypothetical protein
MQCHVGLYFSKAWVAQSTASWKQNKNMFNYWYKVIIWIPNSWNFLSRFLMAIVMELSRLFEYQGWDSPTLKLCYLCHWLALFQIKNSTKRDCDSRAFWISTQIIHKTVLDHLNTRVVWIFSIKNSARREYCDSRAWWISALMLNTVNIRKPDHPVLEWSFFGHF